MEYDDKVRDKVGLAVCLRNMGDGKSRLFFDDVEADAETNPINWKYHTFYTFSPVLENSTLENMDLTDEGFQQIGVAVVARLLAVTGRVKINYCSG